MNKNIKKENCIGKQVCLSLQGHIHRIPEMRTWVGTIESYDPIYDKFRVCWMDKKEKHIFSEHPDFIDIKNV